MTTRLLIEHRSAMDGVAVELSSIEQLLDGCCHDPRHDTIAENSALREATDRIEPISNYWPALPHSVRDDSDKRNVMPIELDSSVRNLSFEQHTELSNFLDLQDPTPRFVAPPLRRLCV
jgi:hypothetical protein